MKIAKQFLKRWGLMFIMGLPSFLLATTPDPVWKNWTSTLLTTDPFVKAVQETPVDVYVRIQQRALAAKKRGEETFSFIEQKPFVEEMLRYIRETRSTLPKTISLERVDTLEVDLNKILEHKIPYHDLVRAAERFDDLVTDIILTENPSLNGTFHQGHSKHEVERMLSRWPDAFVYHSFQEVDPDYFLDSRSGYVHLAGTITNGSFNDGHWLSPKEFKYHDYGHFGYMEIYDYALRSSDRYRGEETLRKFEANRKWIKSKFEELKVINAPLARAVKIILFEIIHERGYYWDWHLLKSQVQTSKWTDVVKLKLANNFYAKKPLKKGEDALLPEARLWILKQVDEAIQNENMAWLKELKPEAGIEVDINSLAEYLEGNPKEIEIRNSSDIRAIVDTTGSSVAVSIYDLSLAQRPALDASVLVLGEIKKALELLTAQQSGMNQWNISKGSQNTLLLGTLQRITIHPTRGIEAHLLSDTKMLTLSVNSVAPAERMESNDDLDPVSHFKVRQILHLILNQQKAQFISQKPIERIRGDLLRILPATEILGPRAVIKPRKDPPVEIIVPLELLNFRAPLEKELSFSPSAALTRVQKVLKRVKYHDWIFYAGPMGNDGAYLQPQFVAYDDFVTKVVGQHGRKWYLSSHATDDEIILTALASVKTSAEHQVRRNLLFRGKRIFGPHFRLSAFTEHLESISPGSFNEEPTLWNQKSISQFVSEIKLPHGSVEIIAISDNPQHGFKLRASYFNPTLTTADSVLENTSPTRGEELYIPVNASESFIIHRALDALVSAAKTEVQNHFLVDGKAFASEELQSLQTLLSFCQRDDHLSLRKQPKGNHHE